MNEIMKIDTIQQYNDYFGVETLHPLVSVIEGSRGKRLYYCRKLYNVYAILLKDTICGQLKYGQSAYDYQRGAMLFIARRTTGCCINPKGGYWPSIRNFCGERRWPV